MQYLQDSGFSTITLYELHYALQTGTALPPRPVVLTFDDSYIDHYQYVFPLLREMNFTATFFVITQRSDSGNPNHLTWAQIAEMSAAGMSMEAHTKDHIGLRGRDRETLVYQVLGSIESLGAHTGVMPHMFSYPAGQYDDFTLSVIGEMPVWRAVTTQSGARHTTDNYLEMPRVRVTNDMSGPGLVQLLVSFT
jgi:peptidoglycan/xylan/chitin deacetylase (PgdA/CDA1 family)